MDYEKNIDERLAGLELIGAEADVLFLVACVRHWKAKSEQAALAMRAKCVARVQEETVGPYTDGFGGEAPPWVADSIRANLRLLAEELEAIQP